MSDRVWYEAYALMANATSHHHVFLVGSSEEAEQRIRNHYPDAVTILVSQGFPWTKGRKVKIVWGRDKPGARGHKLGPGFREDLLAAIR
jgi:hypothetical protein